MTTAQVAHDSDALKSQILQRLFHAGGRVTVEDGTMRSVQDALGIRCSRRAFQKAIGSLICHGRLERYRRPQQWNGDLERPMTIRYPGVAYAAPRPRSTFAT